MTTTQTLIATPTSDGAADRPLDVRRREARERFEALGFPTTRHESWTYTNVKTIANTEWQAPPTDASVRREDLEAHLVAGCDRLVFVDGRLDAALSEIGDLPDGARVGDLGALLADGDETATAHVARHARLDDDAFAALNTASFAGGAAVLVPAGAELERPVHALYVSTPGTAPHAVHPRQLVVAGRGARATLVEHFVAVGGGDDVATFTNAVTEIVADEGATVDHLRLVDDRDAAQHVGLLRIVQGTRSAVRSHAITVGGGLVRNNFHATLDGEGVDCDLNGLTIGRGRQHVDNSLRVDHDKPHCDSKEYFRSVLDDHARGVFAGRIFVAEDAQKTDAKQTSMSLLLSDDARADARPQLEIFADDVKCTHGATVGQLDEDALFYLRSRGLDADAARALMILGFARETLETIRFAPWREALHAMLLARLPGCASLEPGAVPRAS